MKNLCPILSLLLVAGCATTNTQNDTQPMQTKGDMHAQGQGAPGMNMTPQQMQDMQVCMAAGTPGKEQAWLMEGAGRWTGTNTMWMSPEQKDGTPSPCTAVMSSFLDGRFLKCEWTGDMPGMGTFQGLGISGYDNAAGKWVTTWVDNMGTGIMNGDGVRSADGKTMTWTMHYFCPIQKKMVTMREVETFTSNDTMTMDFFGNDPHSGKEFKMMRMEMKRASS